MGEFSQVNQKLRSNAGAMSTNAAPNPSIETARPGKPGRAAQVKR